MVFDVFENASRSDGGKAPPSGAGSFVIASGRPKRMGRAAGLGPLSLCVLLALAACGAAPTDDILPGGVPAATDLHRTTSLPPASVRSVARKDAGWRVIYHPARAPANAEQGAAAALCRLERKRPTQIIVVPMAAPMDDPGARMIDVICG